MKKGKRQINIKINLTNRWLYTLIAVGILAIIGIGIYALTPGTAPNPGHLISDVAPPAPCTAGQMLQWTGTAWSCVSSPVGAVTNNKWCVGNGTAVQCNQNLEGQVVYMANLHCDNGGSLTTGTTCLAAPCGVGKYQGCNGGICVPQQMVCSNSVAGYLVN